MSHPLSQKIDSLITYFFAALFFFVPLLFLPFTNELFEFNKMQLTYALTISITFLYLSQAVLNKRLNIAKSLLTVPSLLFLLSQLLSTIFSIDLHTSLWGYYSRFHGGLLSTISYLLLFFIFISHFSQKKDKVVSMIIPSILTSASLTSIYAVLEHFGIDDQLWVQDVKSRVFSTLGQPNWLSAYIVALLPLPIYQALNSKSPKTIALNTTLSVLFLVTILFTKSRSGIGAAIIVLSLIFIHQLLTRLKSHQPSPKPILIFSITAILTLFLVGTPWSPNPVQLANRLDLGGPLWPEAEPYFNKLNLTTQTKPLQIDRLSQIDQQAIATRSKGERFGGSDSFEIRRFVWEGAVELFKRHPILGTGVETFGYTYYWVKPKGHNLLSEWDFLYNKAHNEYLNFLSNSGALGLGTYSLLILATLALFITTIHSKQQNPLAFAFPIGYISILITNYFGFSVVPIAILFFLFPALAFTLSDKPSNTITLGKGYTPTKKQLKQSYDFPLSFLQYFSLTLLTLIATISLYTIYLHWQADIYYTKGKSYADIGYIGNALPYLQKAVKASPNEPLFHAELSEGYADATLALTQELESPTNASDAATLKQLLAAREDFQNQALYHIDLALVKNPWHLNFYKSKIKVDLSLATYNPTFAQQAITTILKATQLAPTDAKLLYTLGNVYQQANDLPKAREAFSAALALKPDYQDAITALNALPQ